MTADERYPNLFALTNGTISGTMHDWPLLPAEAKAVLAECARLAGVLKAIADTDLTFDAGYATSRDVCAAMKKLARAALLGTPIPDAKENPDGR